MTAGLVGVALTAGVLLALVVAISTRHRADDAADLAALAGATALQDGGDACAEAARVAAANGALLIACRLPAADQVLVTVERSLPGAAARWVSGRSVAQARAGPATPAGDR
jgi:secretion/DNA translocation related TadE-like protein